MPCYNITPSYRRNVVHYNPFYHSPQQYISLQPRYTAPSYVRLFQADFDDFFREVNQSLSEVRKAVPSKSFQPKFDVQEENDKFTLKGELPGVKAEDLGIEFVDKNTLVVKGKIVREESRGSAPTAESEAEKTTESATEESQQDQDVTMSGALPDTASDAASTNSNYHKASVEDEDSGEASASAPEEQQVTQPTNTEQEVSKPAETPQQQQSHYVVSERTIGEFKRVFRFPGEVDQDGVKASLRDGILSVEVPKQVEKENKRKVEIEE